METDIILALDFGRYNSVARWYDPRTRVAELRSIQTTPQEGRSLRTREPVWSVVVEACAEAGWAHALCEAAGLSARVAGTTHAEPDPRRSGLAWAFVTAGVQCLDGVRAERHRGAGFAAGRALPGSVPEGRTFRLSRTLTLPRGAGSPYRAPPRWPGQGRPSGEAPSVDHRRWASNRRGHRVSSSGREAVPKGRRGERLRRTGSPPLSKR